MLTRRCPSVLEPLEDRRLLAAVLSVKIGSTAIASGSVYDAGVFAQGATASLHYDLKNTGDQPLVIDATDIESGSFAVTPDITGSTLNPGESTSLNLLLDTSVQGSFTPDGSTRNLIIAWTDQNDGSFNSVVSNVKFIVAPPSSSSPTGNLGTLSATNANFNGNVSYSDTIDGRGRTILRPQTDLVMMALPNPNNSVTFQFRADPLQPFLSAGNADVAGGRLQFKLVPDTNGNGKMELSERSAAINTWTLDLPTTTTPATTTKTVSLTNAPVGKYFIETRVDDLDDALIGFDQVYTVSWGMNAKALNAGNATVAVTSNGSAVANDAAVNLGSVNAGGTLTRTFTLKNNGAAPMTITGLSVSGTDFEVSEGLPATLAAGASNDFTVELADNSTAGAKAGVVTLTTNDPARPTFTINLAANVTSTPGGPGGGPQPVTVNGTTGNDVILISQAGSTLSVTVNGTKTDYNTAQMSKLIVLAGPGNDKLLGDETVSVILNMTGEGGDDTIVGGAGGDELSGANGKDRVFGGSGNDYLLGGAATDKLYGGAGNDTLSGAGGRDFLYGEAGSNYLIGGAGNDLLFAKGNNTGGAKDTLSGNAGTDLGDYDNDDVLAGLEGVIT
jgi:Ca2+-binding RTX toxin-like protein